MIDNFKEYINLALNKNQMGKVSPTEFNSAIGEASLKNYTELFSEFRKLNYKKGRFQDSPSFGNESGYLKQSLEYYQKDAPLVITDGVAELPEDLFLMNNIFSNKAQVEKVDLEVFNLLKRRNKKISSDCSPIFTFNNNVLKVFPEQSELEINYFRELVLPKWSYRIIDNVAMFDPSKPDFRDIDCHPMQFHKLFVDTLQLLGLNLQNEFALQYTSQMVQQEQINQQ